MNPKLIVMRLLDMHKMHPEQSNEYACEVCGAVVGIYPSGQRAIKDNPKLQIICISCWTKDDRPAIMVPAPGSIEEAKNVK